MSHYLLGCPAALPGSNQSRNQRNKKAKLLRALQLNHFQFMFIPITHRLAHHLVQCFTRSGMPLGRGIALGIPLGMPPNTEAIRAIQFTITAHQQRVLRQCGNDWASSSALRQVFNAVLVGFEFGDRSASA